MRKKLYVICNSHLDPVWLWNRSSGRSAWLNTMHSVTRIMDENPDLKFTCSSSALYRYIEECDPALFDRIATLVNAGRWEITGGWEVQSDVILSRPETLIHQAITAKEYFRKKFGVDVKTGYCVDSFGHAAGLPKILNACGFTHYVYSRSQETPGVFNWLADDGSSVTALHILNSYGTGAGMDFLQLAFDKHLASPLEHQTMFFGVGDHGGGISRKELAFIREMQKSHDIVFSTLGEYFEAIKELPLETVTGELGPVFRGCYSNCHEVKRKIARATRKLLTAEKLGVKAGELQEAWIELCFNHFHDILPGTSIREAYEKDVFPGIGMVEHTADKLIDRQIFRHAGSLDTRYMSEGGVFCWNPHPFSHKTIMSFDGFADPNRNNVYFNALCDEKGNEYPLQLMPPATGFGPCGVAWGKLTAVIDLPAMGEKTFAYKVTEKQFPEIGFDRQRALLEKLNFDVCFDDSHTWGFTLTGCDAKLGEAELVSVQEYANGPVCSILRAKYTYHTSTIILDLCAYAGIAEIGARIRLDWHEVRCALKLAWDHGLAHPQFFTGGAADTAARLTQANYDWPAVEWNNGKLLEKCPSTDEYSMIDWCAARDDKSTAAFFAPDLHSCDHRDNRMRLTLNRPVMYADHAPFAPNPLTGWMDMGNSERVLWIARYENMPLCELPHAAQNRLVNGEVREVTAHEPGKMLPDEFFHLQFECKQVVIQELRYAENGQKELTLMNNGEKVSVDVPEVGKITLPAFSLKTVIW